MESEPLGQELSDQDRVLLVFGYLGPLALVSLLASRREFVKWHAKQGLILSSAWILLYLVMRYLNLLLDTGAWVPLGELAWVMGWLIVFGMLLAALVCIIRGLEGERFKIPLVGDLADRL